VTGTRHPDEHTLLLDMHEMLMEQKKLLCDQRKRQKKLEKEQAKIAAKHGMLSANVSLLLDKLEVFSNSVHSSSDVDSLMTSVDDIRSQLSPDSPRWSDDEDDTNEDDKESVHFSTNESILYDPSDTPREVHSGERSISPVWTSPSARHTSSKATTRTKTSSSICTTNSFDILSDNDDNNDNGSETTLEVSSPDSSPLVSLGRTRSRTSPSQEHSPSLRPPPKIPRTSQPRLNYRNTVTPPPATTPMEIETMSTPQLGDTTGVADDPT
jgi:hypothetical protein